MMRKWQTDEKEMLRNLVQNEEKLSWQKIAKQLNQTFNRSTRTGRQCRSKYMNDARFDSANDKDSNWTADEEKLLVKLYIESGSSWSSFVDKFTNKSENSIKNKFYNKLRKACRKIEKHQNIFLQNSRAHLKYESVISILELCSQIQKWSPQIESRFNKGCDLYDARNSILRFTFIDDGNHNENQISDLILTIRKLSNKIRSYGIFKTKSKKEWKLSEQRIMFILNFNKNIQSNQISDGARREFILNYEESHSFPNQKFNPKTVEDELQSLNMGDFQIEFFFKQDKKKFNLNEIYLQDKQIFTMIKETNRFQEKDFFFV